MSTSRPDPARPPELPASIRSLAYSLALDQTAAEIDSALAGEGIRSILLKGASTRKLLYGAQFRPQADIDLLVAPSDWAPAIAGLAKLGFRDLRERAHLATDSRPLVRDDRTLVDLHRSLSTVPCTPERCWEVLSTQAVRQWCGGREIEMLAPPALVATIALHAAQHGSDEPKPLADLARAVERVDEDTWRRAVGVAAELGAAEVLLAGLRLVEGGAGLAERLGLEGEVSPPVRLRAASAPAAAVEFARVLGAREAAEKRRLLRRLIAPTNLELGGRTWAKSVLHWPGGSVLARLVWWTRLVVTLPRAVKWYWRDRRSEPAQGLHT